MTPFTFIIKRKAYALAALVALTCAGLASCTDDNLVNNNGGGEKVNPADAKLATTTVTFSADAGMQLPNITRAMDPNAPATRAVSVNKYMPLADEGSNLTARIFVVKADESSTKIINGEKAIDPEKVIMGAGEVKWKNTQQIDGGGVSLRSDEDLLTLTWLSNNSVNINPGENWYICGIIGGEYDEHYKKMSEDNNNNAATRLLAKQLYNFYVKFNPSKDHNTRDAKGNLRVTAAFSTGWTKLEVEKTNVINLRSWAFKALGTLLRFKVKRNTDLVKPEAHKYTFASSQLTANGGFMMMPLSLSTKGDRLKLDQQMGLDCEIRPWKQDIDRNFYWQYEDERRLHFNNVTDEKPNEEDATEYGTPIYEYRYTYDAGTMRDGKANNDYDEFYVWGMPIPLPHYNGTTQLTAERGSFMLGQKQPKNAKYDYADEWLYAKAVNPETNSNEYKVIDFSQKRGMGFTAEVGVCRPRFSTMENKKLKYVWPNPLERLAVTNSKTNEKGWHDTNTQHSSESGWGNVSNWSLKQADFKMNFVVGEKKCLPDNYHAPNSEEWGVAVPNIYTTIYDRFLEPQLLSWDYIKPGATPWLEMYNTGEDDMRPIITGGETHNDNKASIQEELHWADYPALYSYFMQDKGMGEMFAIRFDGTHEGAKYKGEQYMLGQRYRCAYRWRFVNMGGSDISNDNHGMRLIVQSRWIGSANVTLRDLKDEKWWGESSPNNPLFQTDCYRVLPCAGFPFTGKGWQWFVSYWSRTRWKAVSGEDNYYSNKTFCYRRICKDGFERGHNDGLKYYLPVRLIVNRDVYEFGDEAPRKKQRDKDETLLISRKADEKVTNWTWTPKY